MLKDALPLRLDGRRILVVEDDFVVAEDIQSELEQQGAVVLGPAASVGAALRLLHEGPRPDRAVLDVNLGGEMVFPVAEALRARDVPFLFLTGYDRTSLPEAYAQVRCYEKPMEMAALLAALTA